MLRVLRVTGTNAVEQADVAAVEEPLEIRLHDRPFAVIMRTPGADRHLAAGFLLAEGLIGSADDLGAVEHCRHPDHPDGHNVVSVFLLGEAAATLPALLEGRRNVLDGRLPLTGHTLAVSGRASYEIVQKAWLAGIEIVCAVSAPSSLAIDLAEEAGITLIGFARANGFNICSKPARVRM